MYSSYSPTVNYLPEFCMTQRIRPLHVRKVESFIHGASPELRPR